MNYSSIRGFNYQPSYGSTGYELWQFFDAETVTREIARGKQYFPGINALRWWLSCESYLRNPALFLERFETALAIADRFGLRVMPVFFNRWHIGMLDYGGVYQDYFHPREVRGGRIQLHRDFVDAVIGAHRADPRVFCWDLCNEPFDNRLNPVKHAAIIEDELRWLADLYEQCKASGAAAPVTCGTDNGANGTGWLTKVEPISDLLSIHPYWQKNRGDTPDDYCRLLDACVAVAEKAGKPLLSTECCWGSRDDAERAEIVAVQCGELKKRNIGWLAYLLHHSLVADAHRPEYGPVGNAGNLSFIEADGSLRPGHEVFNAF